MHLYTVSSMLWASVIQSRGNDTIYFIFFFIFLEDDVPLAAETSESLQTDPEHCEKEDGKSCLAVN